MQEWGNTMWLLVVLVPSTLLSSWSRKPGFAAGMPMACAVLRAVESRSCPALPDSFSAFGELFWQAMEYGPCRRGLAWPVARLNRTRLAALRSARHDRAMRTVGLSHSATGAGRANRFFPARDST